MVDTAAVPRTSAPASQRTKQLALGVLALAQLMVVLDATIVTVALPDMQTSLGFRDQSDLQWVVNAYTLAFGGFLLLGGRIADRYGRRLLFMLGTVLFSAASLLGGFAQTPGVLIAARAVQGLGGALMSPAALSLITVTFEEGEERNRALGVWAAIAGGGAAIGLILGGVLTDGLSWRWVLFVNVPIGAIVLIAAPRFVRESRESGAGAFDVTGAVTVTGGLVALVYALVRANDVGWATAQTLGLFAASAVLLAVFFWRQRVGTNPLMPMRIFRNRSVLGADLAMLLAAAGIFGIFFFLTLYFQKIHGYSPIRTGFAFLPMSIVIILAAGVYAQLVTRIGPRWVLSGGLVVAAAGMVLLMRISPHGSFWTDALLPTVVIALGMAGVFVSVTSAATAGVPADDSGIAAALLNAGQQIGGALGLAILTAVSSARFNAVAPGPGADPGTVAPATTSSWVWGFGVGAALLALGALVGGLLVRTTKEELAGAPAVVALTPDAA